MLLASLGAVFTKSGVGEVIAELVGKIVPVAMLDMKDCFGVIKNQYIPAIIFLIFQIIYMIILK